MPAVEDLAALTVGEDPTRIEHIVAKLRRAADSCGPAGLFTLALSAIDVALWDIKGKALEQPLWKLLGGHRDRVPTYASGLAAPRPDRQAGRAGGAHPGAEGLPRDEDPDGAARQPDAGRGGAPRARCARRDRAGHQADVRHQSALAAPSRRSTSAAAPKMSACSGWRTSPAADDYQGLARVTAALKTPVAGGEYLWGITPFRQMMDAHSVDIVMIDLVRVGGVSQFMKVAAMAEAFNLPVVSHVMPEMLVHVIAACPNGLTVEYMPWMLALYEETPKIDKGELVLPGKAGLGLAFDEKVIARFKA